MMKYAKYPVLIALSLTLTFSCKEDEAPQQLTLPSNLEIIVQEDPEDSGNITVNATSENANFYTLNFGEAGQTFIRSADGMEDYTYTSSGTYNITVRAHATDAAFVEDAAQVVIALEGEGGGNGDGIPTTGYSTPDNYDGMTLVWQDEFDGETLNLEDWTFERGTGSNGWGNNELQFYREENTSLQDGYLIITAKEEDYEGREYTSSRIVTQEKQSFQYGRIDIRAALPKGQGIWPALWMLGESFSTVSWPACGEIDIMEMIGGGEGRDSRVHGTIHWDNAGSYASYGQSVTLANGIFSDKFHVFSIVWDETSITWYLDDVQFNVVDITPENLSEFQEEFFLIFNVAIGGNWPGSPDATTVFPQRMIVDYVRVFQ